MSATAFRKSADQDRRSELLESWKEIAGYVGRSVRAVQKWEKDENLPVHRHQHEKQGTVYAYASELDAWLRSRSTAPAETRRPATKAARWLVASMFALAALLTGGAIFRVGFSSPDPRPLPFAEREWVLVAAFDNHSGIGALDDALQHLVSRELSDSRYVNVIPAERVRDALRLMRRPLSTRIDRIIAQEIALRDGGIRLLLAGRVDKVGRHYLVTAELMDVRDGKSVGSFAEEAESVEALLPATRRIVATIRSALGEPAASVASRTAKLERVTTPSLRALRLYSHADALMFHDNAAAEELLREAIAEDPQFASAHIHLAFALKNQGKPSAEVLAAARRGYDLSATASERERHFIDASYHALVGEPHRAINAYKALLQLYPDHFWAVNNLSSILKFRLGRAGEAAPYRVRLAELRPHEFVSNFAAAESLTFWLGRPAEAERYYKKALELLTPADEAQYPELASAVKLHQAEQAWLRRDAKGAVAELARLQKSVPAAASDSLMEDISSLYTALGRIDDARRVAGQIRDPRRRARHVAALAFDRGDLEEARRLYRELSSSVWEASTLEQARVILLRLPLHPSWARTSPTPADQGWYARQAAEAFANRRPAEALLLLQRGNQLRSISPGGMNAWFLQAEMLASRLAAEGNLREAIAALERASEQTVRTLPDAKPAWLRIRTQLASLYRQSGDVAAASAIETELQQILELSDTDSAADMKRRVRRLLY